MAHSLILLATCLFVGFAFCGSLYVTGFALLGANQGRRKTSLATDARFVVLVPAHNESIGIRATLRSLQLASYSPANVRVMVIADNCNDDTAEVARSLGVETWVRDDPHNRGKGQALHWAFSKIDFPFEMAAVIDADTQIDPDFFSAMDSAFAACLRENQPDVVLQGRYLFAENSGVDTWFDHFSRASKAAEYSFSLRPRTTLGLANLIQGNGFCISKSALAKVPFDATSVVEDAEYAVTLAMNGIRVLYVDHARVVSRATRRIRDAATQRLRWASGTFALLFHSIPALLRGAVRARAWRLAEMAVMLLFTSRLILVYATAVSFALVAFLHSSAAFTAFAFLLAASLFLQSTYLYLILRKADGAPVPFHAIAFMPFYFGFLAVMQLGAILGFGKHQWTRTVR